ncbi:MAG: peptidylprolyl isomerase [Fluviicola sp.]|nr:peptidylprolyl isomerase [Fluviicola sp.]
MIKTFAIALTLMVGFNSFSQEDPTIMTINDSKITKSEFLQIYLKNNNDPQYDKASLDEYMELFKRFKLKVAEAEALGYDTIPKLVAELAGYRKQLALPYLVDSTQNDHLVNDAYYRTKNEVRASHILIKVSPNANAQDTLEAYNRILAMKKRIEDGEDFAMVASAKRGSEDPSAVNNGGDLGYFNAFQMVYPFEDAAYRTKVGEISDPFRTRFGFHIVKVTDKREARGTIESAHVMVSVGKAADEKAVMAAETKITEIYKELEKGAVFEDLVAKYSDDPSSNKKGGVLPTFGTGTTTRMVPSFEDAAFSLKKDGDYSKPIRTDYGYHIVKRISWTDVPSFEDMKKGLEAKVAKDERSKTTQNSFVNKLKKQYSFKDKSSKGLKWFKENLDSTFYRGQFRPESMTKNDALFIMDGQKFGQQAFAKFISKNYRSFSRDDIPTAMDKLYKQWQKVAILDYEESKLPGKYPAFKALITEYHDGILLYEIMSDKVWNKAMKDTTGLENFFNKNKTNYIWGKRIDADIYEIYKSEDADKAYSLLQNDTISGSAVVKAINGDSELNIRKRSGKFDLEKTHYLKGTSLSKGLNKAFEVDGKFYVIKVNELLDSSPKEFSECKGAVTSDYQNYLEVEWLKELAAKHKIEVNTEALYSLGK